MIEINKNNTEGQTMPDGTYIRNGIVQIISNREDLSLMLFSERNALQASIDIPRPLCFSYTKKELNFIKRIFNKAQKGEYKYYSTRMTEHKELDGGYRYDIFFWKERPDLKQTYRGKKWND